MSWSSDWLRCWSFRERKVVETDSSHPSKATFSMGTWEQPATASTTFPHKRIKHLSCKSRTSSSETFWTDVTMSAYFIELWRNSQPSIIITVWLKLTHRERESVKSKLIVEIRINWLFSPFQITFPVNRQSLCYDHLLPDSAGKQWQTLSAWKLSTLRITLPFEPLNSWQ